MVSQVTIFGLITANVAIAVPAFETWAGSKHVAKQFDLKFLKDCTIGIDAAHFLRTLPQESLRSALGGAPLTLDSIVIRTTTELQNAGLNLHFVFNGLDSNLASDAFGDSGRAAHLNSEGFKLYEDTKVVEAHPNFGISGK